MTRISSSRKAVLVVLTAGTAAAIGVGSALFPPILLLAILLGASAVVVGRPHLPDLPAVLRRNKYKSDAKKRHNSVDTTSPDESVTIFEKPSTRSNSLSSRRTRAESFFSIISEVDAVIDPDVTSKKSFKSAISKADSRIYFDVTPDRSSKSDIFSEVDFNLTSEAPPMESNPLASLSSSDSSIYKSDSDTRPDKASAPEADSVTNPEVTSDISSETVISETDSETGLDVTSKRSSKSAISKALPVKFNSLASLSSSDSSICKPDSDTLPNRESEADFSAWVSQQIEHIDSFICKSDSDTCTNRKSVESLAFGANSSACLSQQRGQIDSSTCKPDSDTCTNRKSVESLAFGANSSACLSNRASVESAIFGENSEAWLSSRESAFFGENSSAWLSQQKGYIPGRE